MKSYDFTKFKAEVYEFKFDPRIQNMKKNITNIIDSEDPNGKVRIKGVSYLGTQASSYSNTDPIKDINISTDKRNKITSYVDLIHSIEKDWDYLCWYFAKLSRAKSIGDIYKAVPKSYYELLPGEDGMYSVSEDLYDEKAYEILEQLDLIAYLEQ